MSVSIANGVVAVAPKTIVAGTNITTSETDNTIIINSTGGGGGGVWGTITGTLTAQTDLQTALGLKANTSSVPAQFAPVAGTNIVLSGTYPNITFASTGGGGGGGTTIYSGTVAIDFGGVPGTNMIITTVVGQALLTTNSRVKAYIMPINTTEHNAYEHAIVPLNITCGNIVAGVGFDIYVNTDHRLTGTFNITWEWI